MNILNLSKLSFNVLAKVIMFYFVWLIITATVYLIVVFPFYPELVESSSRESINNLYDKKGYFFLSQLTILIGTVISLRVLKEKLGINLNALLKISNFQFIRFLTGALIGILIILICIGSLILFGLISLMFVNINDFVFSITFFLMVALVEEIIFRGYLLSLLETKMRPNLAVILSSLIFAIVHFFNPNFGLIGCFNIFLSGVLFSILFKISQNISIPIGAHFTWNFTQSLFGFSVSGQDFYGATKIKYNSTNTYLTGGEFGLEGSLLMTPVILLFIYLAFCSKRIFHSI